MTFAGQLRWRLKFERPAGSAGGVKRAGGFETVPGLEIVPAKIRAVRGDETALAGSMEGQAAFTILVRWQPALANASTSWRAVDLRSGETYDIKFVDPMSGHNHRLKFIAEQKGI